MSQQGKPRPCGVCGYKPTAAFPAGVNDHWECSHLQCPNRHPVTAAPSDQAPQPRDPQ